MLLADTQIALEETGLIMIIAVSALFVGVAAALLYAAARALISRRATQDPAERRRHLIRAAGGLALAAGSVAVWYALLQNTPPRLATLRDDALVLHYRRGEVTIPWKEIKGATYSRRTGRRGGETHLLTIDTASGPRRIQVSTTDAKAGLEALHKEIKQRTKRPLIQLPPFKLDLGTMPAQ